jgi:Arc/MetJ family transcription regulator
MASRKTSVAINRDLLDAAQRALGTTTVRETVERAFLEVVRARARAEELEALRTMSGMDLANEKVMRKAWR